MPRKRMLNPSIFSDEEFGELPPIHQLIVIGLMTLADDEGRVSMKPGFIKSQVFPYNDQVTTSAITEALGLIRQRLRNLHQYEIAGKQYGVFLKWFRHQYIQKSRPSTIPLPDYIELHNNNGSREYVTTTVLVPYQSDTIPVAVTDESGSPTLRVRPNTKQNNTKQKLPRTVVDYAPEFEDWWTKKWHPERRLEKQKAFAEWSKIEPDEWSLLDRATANYIESVSDPKYLRYPERFLRAGFWRAFIEANGNGAASKQIPFENTPTPELGITMAEWEAMKIAKGEPV